MLYDIKNKLRNMLKGLQIIFNMFFDTFRFYYQQQNKEFKQDKILKNFMIDQIDFFSSDLDKDDESLLLLIEEAGDILKECKKVKFYKNMLMVKKLINNQRVNEVNKLRRVKFGTEKDLNNRFKKFRKYLTLIRKIKLNYEVWLDYLDKKSIKGKSSLKETKKLKKRIAEKYQVIQELLDIYVEIENILTIGYKKTTYKQSREQVNIEY